MACGKACGRTLRSAAPTTTIEFSRVNMIRCSWLNWGLAARGVPAPGPWRLAAAIDRAGFPRLCPSNQRPLLPPDMAHCGHPADVSIVVIFAPSRIGALDSALRWPLVRQRLTADLRCRRTAPRSTARDESPVVAVEPAGRPEA